jgi:hypothetical protein
MQIADFSSSSFRSEGVQFRILSQEDRARTSGPGLRAFGMITDHFGLTEADRIAVLGDPARSTYHHWMKNARDKAPLTLPLDTLLRVSAILGIYKALIIMFEDQNQALAWLKGPHQGGVFAGVSPMAHMLEGGHEGLMSVRRYLNAWRGGHMGFGAPEGSFQLVTEDDLFFA